jgi:hypothetical protein
VFIRGFINADNQRNLTDALFNLNWLFANGPTPACLDAADVNDDGRNDLSDAVFLLNFLFVQGPTPPNPATLCGADPSNDQVSCQTSHCDSDGDGLSNEFENTDPKTDPNKADTDGDGFFDGEEVLPEGVEGFNIAALGADRRKPDIFVETDWFRVTGGGNPHTHEPLIGALQAVVASFDAAPVQTTLNGSIVSSGITLHIDAGPLNAQDTFGDPDRNLNIPVGQTQQDPVIEFPNAVPENLFAPTATSLNLQPIWDAL